MEVEHVIGKILIIFIAVVIVVGGNRLTVVYARTVSGVTRRGIGRSGWWGGHSPIAVSGG